jgi:SGNH hydrolase-like domain, acetyltransferase AlgX
MKRLHATAFCCLWLVAASVAPAQIGSSEAARKFRHALRAKLEMAEKENAQVLPGVDGWLFLAGAVRFLAAEKFWGGEAPQVSRSRKPQWADPIPAIVDFNRQLKERGIELLLAPVPPKAAVYPEKIVPDVDVSGNEHAAFLNCFYDQLRAQGVAVLDLEPLFFGNRASENGALYCKTDSHWSGSGCVLAAEALARVIAPKLPKPEAPKSYGSEWRKVALQGDLKTLLGDSSESAEEISVRTVCDKATGAAVAPDPESPLLLLGDSHLLVFHDFVTERAGLLDQLALELGFAPDLIGTRGSGATPVRITLYRRSLNDPDYLKKKKVIVWCFAAREFTEAEQGWVPEPVAK